MNILILAGASGSGKSQLALDFAERFHKHYPAQKPEIICADSITLYKGCDIGSAKPSLKDQARFPHHLLDICEPDQNFTAANFVERVDSILEKLKKENGLAILVGGTGFYLRALLQGMTEQDEAADERAQLYKEKLLERAESEGMEVLYQEMLGLDPELTRKIHGNDHYRIIRALQAMQTTGKLWSELNQSAKEKAPRYQDYRFFCLELPRARLRERIAARTDSMLAAGLLDEVEILLKRFPPSCKALQSVGYRECLEYLGKIAPQTIPAPKTKAELAERITQSTARLAKRQMNWFRSEKSVEWLSVSDPKDFLPTLAERLLLP